MDGFTRRTRQNRIATHSPAPSQNENRLASNSHRDKNADLHVFAGEPEPWGSAIKGLL